ncbi:alpha/beta fold hydrolase [Mycolicibacterium mengxianglii]|uniref:alpha/beta fold hydrolase n=1 Tax=Mycolicibacterium mengxianglii TaxID=2736649 RepID=UPI001E46B3BE|nr:alpha/beta fold hydrolase [Mycolicibacterium mengxianglii]
MTSAEPAEPAVAATGWRLPKPRAGALGVDIAAVMTSSVATGALGFLFWTVAARGYSPAEVGRASALISSASLIAILANFSLGSLYERFLPVAGSQSKRLVRNGTLFVIAAALAFGAAFVLLGPDEQLFGSLTESLLFPVAVAVLAVFAIQDQVLVGIGRATTLAAKNITQSTVKLIAIAAFIPLATGTAIVWAWVLPAAVIAGWVLLRVIQPATGGRDGEPALPPNRDLFHFFLSSYAINAVGVVVPLLLPLIIVAQLGTETNAYFSMSWLVINTVAVLIHATGAPFIAAASAPGADIKACIGRFTLMCGGAGAASCVGLFLAAPYVLHIMGPAYAEQGTNLIRIFALSLPSLAIYTIYASLARLRRRLRLAVTVQVMIGVIVVVGIVLTTPRWGIDAVGYTYLAAELLGTLIIAVPLVRLLRHAWEPSSDTLVDTGLPAAPAPAAVHHEPAPAEDATVWRRFLETADAHGDEMALRTADGAVTYRQLASAAAAWSTTMRHHVSPDSTIALLAGLGPDSAATVLGAMAAGRVLTSLDPRLPVHRTRAIVDMLGAHGRPVGMIVTDDANQAHAGELATGAAVHRVESPPEVSGAAAWPDVPAGVDTLTTVQFTSGSTGVPKAVLHANGMWLCDAILMRTRFDITPGRRIALCMPVSFGAGINILLGALMSGADILGIDPRDVAPAAALRQLRGRDVEILVCTPSFLNALIDAAAGTTLPTLTRIVTTGEPANVPLVRRARTLAPAAVFTNWVGSSEANAISTYDIAPGDELPSGVIPAGDPAPLKRVTIAGDGTMSVTSRYLGMGYLVDPGDNASVRFAANSDGTRTVVTGDRARWSAEAGGTLMLLGRADTAVKIRGYLVEPAEIEAALLEHPAIREAAVRVDTTGGAPVLAAYAAPVAHVRAPSVAELRATLHEKLPTWMVPTHILTLAALPRTERGKVDLQALPEPVRGPLVTPCGATEEQLAKIWAQALALEAVGRTENFYALGGDSLTVQAVLSRVARQFGVQLPPSSVAGAPTVAQFAAVVHDRISRSGERPDALACTTVALRPISGDTTAPPIFCFAGAGASALSFTAFADRVRPTVPVYAFQPQGLENRAIPDWTVGAAARRHLADLRRLQPHGPYQLVGHSLGGFIALEVARQLRELGETVEMVTLLDPYLPPRAMRAARGRLPDATLTLDATPRSKRELWIRRLCLPLAGIVQFDPQTQASMLEAVGTRVGRFHKPRPWPGRALVVLSHLNDDDPRLWPFVLAGRLRITRITCDHESIVREPHIRQVVSLIEDESSSAPVDSAANPGGLPAAVEAHVADDAVVI